MSDFKIGDRAYWFNCGNGETSANVPIEDLHIESTNIVCDAELKQRSWCYKSRREALEALSARLKELLDNDK